MLLELSRQQLISRPPINCLFGGNVYLVEKITIISDRCLNYLCNQKKTRSLKGDLISFILTKFSITLNYFFKAVHFQPVNSSISRPSSRVTWKCFARIASIFSLNVLPASAAITPSETSVSTASLA